LYKQLAAQIEADIAAGRYPVGSLLPTEAEFSAQLDAGRHTVREALRLLSDGGLIARRAGSGSTVLSASRPNVYAHTVSNFDQWFTYPEAVQRRRVEHGPVLADAALADSLGCAPGTPWFRIGALRLLDGAPAPLCWVDIYLLPRFAGVLKSKTIDSVPVHEQIEKRYRVAISQVEVRISATRVPPALAGHLQAEPDSAALLLQRRYFTAGGELLQATRTVHPEGRYVYAMQFHRAAAGAFQDR
jgi:DNA-binding GntR family transcriptional regulator